MDVWIIESRDSPSDRMILGVASSVEAAAKFMRDTYGSPYVVKWDAPVRVDDDNWRLTGQFTAVAGHCGEGPQSYEFTRFTLDQVRK